MRRSSAPRPAGLALEGLEGREVPALVGGLDPSFDTDGKVALAGAPLTALALQPDGKTVVAGSSAGDFFVARYNPGGSLDMTFDDDGIRTFDFGGTDAAAGVAVQADGKIVVAGSSTAGAGGDFAVARLNANGSLDNTFDIDGLKLIDFGGAADAASAVTIQSDGKIVLAGSDASVGGGAFAAARLNPTDGSLDLTFNGTGRQTVDVGGGADAANAVALLSDGRVVMAGNTASDFALAVLNPTGTVDGSFNSGGTKTIDYGGTDVARGVAVQPDGKIVVVGGNGTDIAVARVNAADGSLDTSFNAGGAVPGALTVDVAGADDARAVLLQPNGKILVVGDSATGVAVVRLNANGIIDGSFNGTGKATFDLSPAADLGAAAVRTPAGRLVIAGRNAAGTAGTLSRVVATLDEPTRVAAGGSRDGKARVYATNPATAMFGNPAAATVGKFGTTTASARTATGDVNGDGVADTILITGPGTPLRLAVVSGADDSTVLVAPFDPLGGNFTGGGSVAAGDFDNDGRAEVVVTPDQGGGPRVSVFSLQTDGSFTQRVSFFGIDDPDFRGGARVGVGDVDGDGVADLAVAAGFGGGPRVAVFDGATVFGSRFKLVNDFFAFDDVLRNGVYVTVGDLNGDGYGDLVFGAGPGGGPRVLAVSGLQMLSTGTVPALAAPLANFFVAGNTDDRGGVRVATADVDGDNKAEVVVGTGEGQASRVRAYYGKNFGAPAEPTGFQDLDPFGGQILREGVFIG